MLTIASSLNNQESSFAQMKRNLEEKGFALGGNWDYEQGSFDCALDEANKVWLRLPFRVLSGNLDGEDAGTDARIRFGEPYVLRHEYEEGLDQDAQPRTLGGLFDQFAAPSNPDAAVDAKWADQARSLLAEVENFATS